MSKIRGLPTEQPPEVDVDEEGSPMNPEEGVLRSPKAAAPEKPRQGQAGVAEGAANCEDVFCETKTVDESPLMKMTQEQREQHLKSGAATGR